MKRWISALIALLFVFSATCALAAEGDAEGTVPLHVICNGGGRLDTVVNGVMTTIVHEDGETTINVAQGEPVRFVADSMDSVGATLESVTLNGEAVDFAELPGIDGSIDPHPYWDFTVTATGSDSVLEVTFAGGAAPVSVNVDVTGPAQLAEYEYNVQTETGVWHGIVSGEDSFDAYPGAAYMCRADVTEEGYAITGLAINGEAWIPDYYGEDGSVFFSFNVPADQCTIQVTCEHTDTLRFTVNGVGNVFLLDEDGDVEGAPTISDTAILPASSEELVFAVSNDVEKVTLNGEEMALTDDSNTGGYLKRFTVPALASGTITVQFSSADAGAEVLEALPDAPFELNIVPRSSGLGCIVYGIPISTSSAIVSVTEASDLFAVPEGGSIGVFDEYADPTEITDGPFATGQMIQVTDSSGEVAAWGLTVVRGDVTGSGMMNLTQLVRESRALNGTEPLEGLYLAAGDLTGTGEINLTDMVQMAAMFQTAE